MSTTGVPAGRGSWAASAIVMGEKPVDIDLEKDARRVDWHAAANLFDRVGWGARDPGQLARAFASSRHVRYAFDGDRLVGFARAISDGEYYATLQDVIVSPEYQGCGLGTRMVRALMEDCAGYLFTNVTSAPGRDGFYERLGFRKQKTAFMLMLNPDSPAAAAYVE